jgi:hypothetical protein
MGSEVISMRIVKSRHGPDPYLTVLEVLQPYRP